MPGQAKSRFPQKKHKSAALSASGHSARPTAGKIGVHERTVHVWRHEPEFIKLVERYQTRMIGRAMGRLAGTATKAVNTLGRCLESQDGDTVRVRAAVAILDQLVRLRDVTELEARIVALEKKIGNRG
jgi:hypothetical protein